MASVASVVSQISCLTFRVNVEIGHARDAIATRLLQPSHVLIHTSIVYQQTDSDENEADSDWNEATGIQCPPSRPWRRKGMECRQIIPSDINP